MLQCQFVRENQPQGDQKSSVELLIGSTHLEISGPSSTPLENAKSGKRL